MKTDYGAVDDENTGRSYGTANENEDPTEFYDAEHPYYLKDAPNERNRMKKLLLAAFPIIIAIVIIGGAAFFLLQDFGHLYPGRSGEHHSSSGYHGTTTSSTPSGSGGDLHSPTSNTKPAPSSPSKSGEASCDAHPKCDGLTGNCCPTNDGITLGCCN